MTDIDTVLAPVDGTDAATEAATYAVAIADRYDADLHVVYVLGEGTVRAMDAGSVAPDSIADESRAYLGEMRGLAAERSVPITTTAMAGFSTSIKTLHPGNVVLDLAEEIDADFLVVPREEPGSDERDVLAKAAEYVLLYASQPVLSV